MALPTTSLTDLKNLGLVGDLGNGEYQVINTININGITTEGLQIDSSEVLIIPFNKQINLRNVTNLTILGKIINAGGNIIGSSDSFIELYNNAIFVNMGLVFLNDDRMSSGAIVLYDSSQMKNSNCGNIDCSDIILENTSIFMNMFTGNIIVNNFIMNNSLVKLTNMGYLLISVVGNFSGTTSINSGFLTGSLTTIITLNDAAVFTNTGVIRLKNNSQFVFSIDSKLIINSQPNASYQLGNDGASFYIENGSNLGGESGTLVNNAGSLVRLNFGDYSTNITFSGAGVFEPPI
jgi:hypothetical protein